VAYRPDETSLARWSVITATAGMSACTLFQQTPYQPYSAWGGGGYSETEVQPGLFLVRFTGNESTTPGRAADLALLQATERALNQGIGAALAGARLGDVSAAIGAVARAAGYGLHTDFGGHGVGRTMHESPSVPNDGRAGRGMRLRPGLTIAIEPWFLAGGLDAYRTDPDGWTLRSTDGSRGAHFEHTVAVTDDGPVILTSR